MRALLPRILLVAAAIALAAAALLGTFGMAGPAVAALAGAVAALAALATADRREMMRLLRTQRSAQNAAYERMRRILAATESLPSGRPDGAQVAMAPAPPIDPRSADVAALVGEGGPGVRALLIGGELPAALPRTVVPIELVELGADRLSAVPHRLHTHILIDLSAITRASHDDLRWLRRAFRWQHDTVIAIPARSAQPAREALSAALGSALATTVAGDLIHVSAPLGGGPDWGAA